jgi:thiol:disulfide interchange protein DsbA
MILVWLPMAVQPQVNVQLQQPPTATTPEPPAQSQQPPTAATPEPSADQKSEPVKPLATPPVPPPVFKEGTHYQRLATPVPTATGDRIEVVEAFWYGCPHCHHLEPIVEAWLKTKPAHVEFVRIPAVLGRQWEPLARAYYAAETLGVLDRVHKPLFVAVQARKPPLNDAEQLADFFASQGIDRQAFLQTYRSFGVETRLQRSKDLIRRYGITGVPAVIINGKFVINAESAGSPEKIFEVVDYLASKEKG